MTEAQWLACEDPSKVWVAVGEGTSERKLRLLGCACCRLVWRLMRSRRCQKAVELAEGYADEPVNPSALERAARSVWNLVNLNRSNETNVRWAALYTSALGVMAGPADRAEAVLQSVLAARGGFPVTQATRDPALCGLLRDILGNPFRPATVSQSYLTPTVAALAQAAYDERTLPSGHIDLTRLAILSDALEEAGCSDSAILSHLRSAGPHVRGCWALDLILGKQ
jgi:hypothetical protein